MVGVYRSARRTLPLLIAAALATGALAAFPDTARAASGDLDYVCDYGSVATGVPTQVTIDTDTPDTSPVAAPLRITTTLTLTIAADVLGRLQEAAPGFDRVWANSDLGDGVQESYVGPTAPPIAVTAHPDLSTKTVDAAGDAVFSGAGGANVRDPGPSLPGTYQITAGALAFHLYADSTNTGVAVTCTPVGAAAVVDTLEVTDTTTTALSALPATWTYGDAIAATATVTRTPPPATADNPAPSVPSTWPAATGAVQLLADGDPVGAPVQLAADGTAKLPLGDVPRGTPDLTAAYLPADTSPYLPSTAEGGTVTVDVATTTTILITPSAGEVGDMVTATATVHADDGTTPVGQVTFVLDGTALDPVTLSDGHAEIAVPTDTAGQHTVTASYAGADLYEDSHSEAASLNVSAHPTTTTLSLDPATASTGDTVTASASVSSAHGVPGGTVTFSVDGQSVTATLADGVASVTLPELAAGTYDVTAVFTPDSAAFAGSSAAPQSLQVGPAATTTTLRLALVRAAYGQRVLATARVTAAHGTPVGAVTFSVDGRSVSAALVHGTARVALPFVPPGPHEVTATFVPSSAGSFASSTSTPVRYVVLRDTSRVLQTVTKARHGRQLRCRIVVRATHTTPVTGRVRMVLSSHGSARMRMVSVTQGSGTARFTTPRRGRWSLVATYLGNATVEGAVNIKHGRTRR